MNLNKVMIAGNLTRDPEVRFTPNKGTPVVDLGLAINRVYSTDDGQKREDVTFVDVTLWGRTAEIAQQYLHKGSPVFIEGRLQLDTWEDKESGQKRSRLRVVGENMQLLGSKEGAGSLSSRAPAAAQSHIPKLSASPPPRAGVRVPDLDA
jgi:single-strand DNA-binding protein